MKTKLFLTGSFLLLSICLTSAITTNAQSVSAGSLHSLFLCRDSIPRACGTNVSGQLGIGNTFSFRSAPTQITGLTQITAVSAGANMSLFLKADGTVWACGDNQAGQLGNGTTTTQFTPVQLSSLSDIIAVSAGGSHSLFLKNDGTVWACGNNQVGQLGDGTNVNQTTPVQVLSLSDIIAVSAGSFHSLFLKDDGTVYLCGLFAAQNTPVQIPALSDVTKISAGEGYSLFLKNNGTVMALGSNLYGQLGDGSTTEATTPVAVNALTDITEIKAGPTGSSLFLKDDGTVWACGINNSGQFGTGVNNGFDPNPNPAQLTGLSNIVALTTGWYHSVFVKNDETAQSSGGNSQGQLGNSTTVNSLVLVPVTDMCSSLSAGINESAHESSVAVFPNPSNGIVNFIAPVTFPGISIYNLLGEVIYTQKATSPATEIDLTDRPKGVYLYQLTDDGQILKAGKIIIQ